MKIRVFRGVDRWVVVIPQAPQQSPRVVRAARYTDALRLAVAVADARRLVAS